MSSRLWLFGDSFTAGFGVEQTSEYYKNYGPGKTFDILLGEHFNKEVVNLGVPGISNYGIITILSQQLEFINANDLVVVGNTSPLRGLVPNKEGTALIDQKLFDSTPYTNSLANNNSRLEKILRDYCLEFQKEYIPLWSNYFNKIYLGLLRALSRNNVKTILWDYSVWSEEIIPGMKFENIYQHTAGEIYDLHWSFKGHLQAYQWIREGIEQEKKFIKMVNK